MVLPHTRHARSQAVSVRRLPKGGRDNYPIPRWKRQGFTGRCECLWSCDLRQAVDRHAGLAVISRQANSASVSRSTFPTWPCLGVGPARLRQCTLKTGSLRISTTVAAATTPGLRPRDPAGPSQPPQHLGHFLSVLPVPCFVHPLACPSGAFVFVAAYTRFARHTQVEMRL